LNRIERGGAFLTTRAQDILAIEAEARADERKRIAAIVEVLAEPDRYSTDEHGTLWNTDMEHGWETAQATILALLERSADR
jgi:hypothetical protein